MSQEQGNWNFVSAYWPQFTQWAEYLRDKGLDPALSCLLMVRQVTTGWKIAASNPVNESLTTNATVNRRSTTIQLPGGNYAGSSVTIEQKE